MADFDWRQWRARIPHDRNETLIVDGSFSFATSELAAPPLQLRIGEHLQPRSISPANVIGIPHHFTEGRFSGQTLRAELEELQRPEYGRRFGAVDRRPLDDPPGKDWEQEIQNYDDIPLIGLICMVDLFEVPFSLQPSCITGNRTSPFIGTTGASSMTPDTPYNTRATEYGLPPNTLTLIHGYRVTESSKRTTSLFGTKFVEPHKITFPGKNQKQIVFTLSLEGYFILRYRFFDLFYNRKSDGCSTILAETYGESFKIYSSKEAPPLKESTSLTKCLAKHGVPVKIRNNARSPRKNKA
ncbi:hypothetical protein B0H12DRAFT_272519 [Mycena haematopus]|nr:hypothetical protein B0H12DRAFT_272519 [Mycena haematopus]